MQLKQWLLTICVVAGLSTPAAAQILADTAYPVSVDENGKCVVGGFVPFDGKSDDEIYASAFVWAVNNACTSRLDAIEEKDLGTRQFRFKVTLASPEGGKKNTYYCDITLRANEGKLFYYISDILIESTVVVMKKVTPMERLNPEKKTSHRETVDDFVQAESLALNQLFEFVRSNRPGPLTHKESIVKGEVTEGMTEAECLMTAGKPQSVSEGNNGAMEWKYGLWYYINFKNGRVTRVVK